MVRSASALEWGNQSLLNIRILTVKRNHKVDSTISGPFLDFANIGGQGRLVHSTSEDLASGRHGRY